ncbi:Oidioi.mRNA.OKI2018_I69.chr1.g357.t1.cds [Oikopleura dioica]|uniref:Oidioi.mRNA.OKI2018_I69.chr1.g357.t1.cds n=1 Tax=Oikopleura dioica TaxID=34765 RepID=A0ABN7SQV3_OIKDI|nr:Oidioi.mRNA.OKI2018_I69.chr1.g357.t1.cds [Oikopleura dioica]
MGNQYTTIKNETTADFYVMSFNDADLVYSQYYLFKRCPAGQTIDIGTSDKNSKKISLFAIFKNLITGFNKGDYDLWRVRNHEEVVISYIGDKKGAGVRETKNAVTYLTRYTYRFDPVDSKAVAGTMDGIRRWAAAHPNDPVNK